MLMDMNVYAKQNDLLLTNLITYYSDNDYQQLDKILPILNGTSPISLRIIDWFVTNYAKQHYVVYILSNARFKVYNDYKLKLKAYSKKRFDPFCRWEKNVIPYRHDQFIQTTIGQLNFFKWILDNDILTYIQENYESIEQDMMHRNTSKPKTEKNRKKREELSIFASKTIKKEVIEVQLSFD
jgi:hypothetical protein